MNPAAPLRYGRIAFVNVAPVETAFDAGAVARDVTVVRDTPTRLNARLLAGELDVAAISSAVMLMAISSGVSALCIASAGPVRSVLLVSPVPPALLDGVPIALTAQSATARALLQILLERVQGVRPQYDEVDDAPAAVRAGRPALLIGDEALAARRTSPPACIYDLGEAWYAWTSLPFVYAVWAVRKDALTARPTEVAALASALAQLPFHRGLYVDYFSRLSYVLDADARRGLERFAELTEEDRVAR